MTDNHKFQQKGVGAFRGGRNENHNNRNLTSSHNRISGGSIQLPSLSPLFQQTFVEQQQFNQQQKELRMQNASSPLSPTWQEPVYVGEFNAADKFSPSEKNELVSESSVDNLTCDPSERQHDDFFLYHQLQFFKQQQKGINASPLPPTWQEPADLKEINAELIQPEKKEPVSESPIGNVTCPIFDPIEEGQEQNDDFLMSLHLIAPLTPKSLSNSPSMPTKPRQPLLESFDSDSDEETLYNTTGFFPDYSSIERRPH